MSGSHDARQAVMDGAAQEIAQLEQLIRACRNMQDELRESLVLMEEGYTMTTILARGGKDTVIPG